MADEQTHKIKQLLEESGADALIVVNHERSGQPETLYLSGFSGSASILLIGRTSRCLITDGRYYLQAPAEAPGFNVIQSSRERFFNDLRAVCATDSVRRALVDPERTFHKSILQIRETIPTVECIFRDSFLQGMRIVKSADEITLLREAAAIACRTFNRLLPEIREGMTEKALQMRLEYLMIEEGADRPAFANCVAGLNGASPHGKSGNKPVARGELLTFDFGAQYRGYVSDMTRTVAFGEVSAKLRDIYETVRMSQAAGCAAVKAGMKGRAIDAVCRDVIEQRGYGNYFTHGTGHGIGLQVHELPKVNKFAEEPIPAGAVITIEPGVYIEGIGGVRIEDMVVVGDAGGTNLNDLAPRELLTLR